jgi:hypothetical protein
LLACCDGITKEAYLNGSFKTNHLVPHNQSSLLRQARTTLWNSLRDIKIKNVTVKNEKHFYMKNHKFENRQSIFNEYEAYFKMNNNFKPFDLELAGVKSLNSMITNSKATTANQASSFLINTILEDSNVSCDDGVSLLNCHFKSSKIQIGKNTNLNDIILVIKFTYGVQK